MSSSRLITLTTVFLLLISGTATAAIYKWKDKNGQVHYGSMPPQGTQAQKMGVSTTFSPPPETKAVDKKSPGNSNKAANGGKDKKDPYTKEQHATLCLNARKDMDTMNKKGRLRVKQEDGSTAVMSEKDRNARMKTMQDMINKHCK